MSVGSGIDGITLRRENCNFDGVLQDKWGSAETTMGVCDCSYERTMGTDVYVNVNFFMTCAVLQNEHCKLI